MKVKFILAAVQILLMSEMKLSAQTIEVPVLQLVTVDRNTQQVFMKWTITQPSLVDGYTVKRLIYFSPVNININTVATINDRNQMSYTDISVGYGPANPDFRSETYRIDAFSDATGTRRLSNMSNAVSTIFLEPIAFDQCKEQNSLRWTSFKGFGNLIDGYRVYYSSTQTGPPVFVANISKTDTSYIHQQVQSNVQYFYFIVAYSSSSPDSSMSNIKGVTTTMPAVPTIMNADFASVEGADLLNLSFTTDEVAEIYAYKLLKSLDKNGPWDTIAAYPRGTAKIEVSDFIKTSFETWYYKVLTINNCRIESRQSNLAHNMILEAKTSNQKYVNEINWTPYTTWYGGIDRYRVFRSIDGGGFEEIAVIDPGTQTYSDDIEQFVEPDINGQPTKGHFCYYVEATEGAGNPYGIIGVGKTNISCAHQETVVFIPNAFNPNSQTEENRTFKPVVSFVNDYKLIIYNRVGEIVFQSTDPLYGWDGLSKGQLLQKGTYVYFLSYRTKDNQRVEKTGQINLVY